LYISCIQVITRMMIIIIIVFVDTIKQHVIDISVPLTHNLQKTEAERIRKYENLALEIKNIRKFNNVAISAVGVVTKSRSRVWVEPKTS